MAHPTTTTGARQISFFINNAQAIRALLLAMATVTSRGGRSVRAGCSRSVRAGCSPSLPRARFSPVHNVTWPLLRSPGAVGCIGSPVLISAPAAPFRYWSSAEAPAPARRKTLVQIEKGRIGHRGHDRRCRQEPDTGDCRQALILSCLVAYCFKNTKPKMKFKNTKIPDGLSIIQVIL